MRSFLPLLCFLCAPRLQCAFEEGTCLRKEPSPGSLVLSTGSALVLTCSGQVTVDGVKVRNGSNSSKRGGLTDEEEQEEEDGEGEREGGSRVTRGLRRQWKWTRRTTAGQGDKDVTFTSEAELPLSSVKLTDSGTYTCFYRGKEMHTFKVIVADPPEKPNVTCYQRSHGGQIRCESTPQEIATVRPSCHLLSKRPTQPLRSSPCSYSSRTSRCWCTVDYRQEDRRASHYVFMCVRNIAGNVTSNVVPFIPMSILKPNPPSNVTAWQVEGHSTRIKVTWKLPTSWRHHGYYYKILFELKYRPLMSPFQYEQLLEMKNQLSVNLTDVLPGVDYAIQLRAHDEFEGLWSDWSVAVCARSWTAPTATSTPDYTDIESSGTDSIMTDVAPTLAAVSTDPAGVSTHIVWISAILAYLCVFLAVYIFSHRERFLSKLQSVVFRGGSGEPAHPRPSDPPATQGQALVTLGPQSPQEQTEEENEEEENEERHLNENNNTVHFNNISYFFFQQ